MYQQAYIDYLVQFHGLRDYFECHEILEEHWKQEGQKDHYWVGLIQIAVSLYHYRRGNVQGARRMLEKAIAILANEQEALTNLGLDYPKLMERLQQKATDIREQKPYSDMDFPILDQQLVAACEQECQTFGCLWGQLSDLSNQFLVHKHKLRDRTDVIAERALEKKRRESNQ